MIFYKLNILVILILAFSSCGIYSFTGADVDGETIKIDYIENQTSLASPYLAPTITQQLKERIQSQTRLELSDLDSTDLYISGVISKYLVDVASVGNIDEATINRLKIAVNIKYDNKLDPSLSYSRTFERYADFDASQTLQQVEQQKIDEIVEQLVNDIFNNTFANW